MALLDAVISIFSIIFFGWLAKKFSLLSEKSVSALSNYAYYFALPALFFISLYKLDFRILNADLLLAITVPIVLIIVIAFLASVFQHHKGKQISAYLVSSFLGSNVYIAFPFISLALGESAVPIAAIIAAIYFFIGSTFGVFVLQYYSGKKVDMQHMLFNLVKVPVTWSVILGVVVSYLVTYNQIQVPEFIVSAFSLLGASASATALFALGVFMHKNSIPNLKEVIKLCTLKNLVAPAIAFAFVILFPFRGMEAQIIILQAAMPMGVTNFVLAEQFKTEKELVGNAIIVSTILSLFLLPLAAKLIRFI
ncbi:MAG: AEC family transporter [Candidatus Micrarchaeota archaeon]|nr:AEC family transporter [Candidatus Micrarchaeota archaeon]